VFIASLVDDASVDDPRVNDLIAAADGPPLMLVRMGEPSQWRSPGELPDDGPPQ
jgi:hypothetical protein